jgi:hypothetical protein
MISNEEIKMRIGFSAEIKTVCITTKPGDKRQKAQDVTAKLVRFDILPMVDQKKNYFVLSYYVGIENPEREK